MYRRTVVSIALVCQMLTGCRASHDSSGVVRIDSAGVEIVVSSGVDFDVGWSVRREFALGGAESGPESFDIVTPSTVGIDTARHLFVLDLRARRVVVFSQVGQFVRELGREGEGPGELTFPGSMVVTPDGTVSVFDAGKGRLVRFGPDGAVLRELDFPFYGWPGQARHMSSTAGGMLVASSVAPDDDNTVRNALQLIGERDTIVVAYQTFPRPDMVRYPTCGGGFSMARIFEVELSWSVSGEVVVVNRTPAYEFEEYREGVLIRRVRRDVALRAATEAMAVAELGEGLRVNFGQGVCVISPVELVNGRGFAPDLPWIDDLTRSPDGEVWVKRRGVGVDGTGPLDVFSPSGAYLGSMPSGTPFPILFLDDDRFVAAERDEFDITRVVVYRLDRG